MVSSIITGVFYGLLFGSLDVEDDSDGRRLMKDTYIAVPFGGIVGVVIGFLQYSLDRDREKEMEQGKLDHVL